jgi:hypothetical protein
MHLGVNQVLSRKPDALNAILTPIILILSLVLVPTKQKHPIQMKKKQQVPQSFVPRKN